MHYFKIFLIANTAFNYHISITENFIQGAVNAVHVIGTSMLLLIVSVVYIVAIRPRQITVIGKLL